MEVEGVPAACNPSLVLAVSARIVEASCVDVEEEVPAFCSTSLVFSLSAGFAEACCAKLEEGVPAACAGISGVSLPCCRWDIEEGFKVSGRYDAQVSGR